MAITVECSDQQSIRLDEYVDFCRSQPRMSDRDVVLSTAFMLRRLANNDHFFHDYLNRKLQCVEEYNVGTDFTPPSFYLHNDKQFSVRAVLWFPCEGSDASDSLSLGYGITHNHHFDFLTCGYSGPGYRTVIHLCDKSQVTGLIGEKVEVAFQDDTLLTPGKLMLYRHTEDIHVQYPPESLSISINLVLPPHPEAREQCAFDPESWTISSHLDPMSTTTRLFKVAKLIHNEETVDRLMAIISKHCHPRVRAMAYFALFDILPEERARLIHLVEQDASRFVRELFAKH